MRKRHSAHERSAAVNLRLIRPICGPTHHFNVLEAVRGLTQPAHFVALSSERLLLFQECSPRCEPSIVGHHRVIGRQTVISHHRGILLDVRGEVVMETCDVHHPAWPRATRDVSYLRCSLSPRTSRRRPPVEGRLDFDHPAAMDGMPVQANYRFLKHFDIRLGQAVGFVRVQPNLDQ
jgi:hypothetical protein